MKPVKAYNPFDGLSADKIINLGGGSFVTKLRFDYKHVGDLFAREVDLNEGNGEKKLVPEMVHWQDNPVAKALERFMQSSGSELPLIDSSFVLIGVSEEIILSSVLDTAKMIESMDNPADRLDFFNETLMTTLYTRYGGSVPADALNEIGREDRTFFAGKIVKDNDDSQTVMLDVVDGNEKEQRNHPQPVALRHFNRVIRGL